MEPIASLRELLDPQGVFGALTDIEFGSVYRIVCWDDVETIATDRIVGYRTVTQQLNDARKKIKMIAALDFGIRLHDAKAVYRFFVETLILPRIFPTEAA